MTTLHRPDLPAGVELRPLDTRRDPRGALTEIFRHGWLGERNAVQWNVVTSAPGVLRGVHVHRRHDDYLITLQGRASIGLCDLRPGSPTARKATIVEMSGATPAVLFIPH